VHFHIIPGESSGVPVGESGMTDAERKNLVLGEGPRVKIEKDGEEISRLVREEIAKEAEGPVESGKLRWDEEGGDLWLRLLEKGLKL
jgi:hypothetical protein